MCLLFVCLKGTFLGAEFTVSWGKNTHNGVRFPSKSQSSFEKQRTFPPDGSFDPEVCHIITKPSSPFHGWAWPVSDVL